MTAPWFTAASTPAFNSKLLSAAIRAEFAAVETAMNKLPGFTGNEGKPVIVNSGGTALTAVSTIPVDLLIGAGTDVDPDGAGAGQLVVDGNGYNGYIALNATAMYLGHNSGTRKLVFQTDETDRMTIDASGNLGLGTGAPNINGWGRALTLNGDANSNLGLEMAMDGDIAGYLSYSQSADVLSGFNVYAYTGLPLIFGTNNVARGRIDASGNWVVGTAAILTNATDGFLYVPGCAGTPTGVPTSHSGRVPIVIDTTNNRLYFYSGGAWRNAGP